MKKFISLTLALVMVLSVLSVMTVSVSAAETYTSAGKTLINYDFTIQKLRKM